MAAEPARAYFDFDDDPPALAAHLEAVHGHAPTTGDLVAHHRALHKTGCDHAHEIHFQQSPTGWLIEGDTDDG